MERLAAKRRVLLPLDELLRSSDRSTCHRAAGEALKLSTPFLTRLVWGRARGEGVERALLGVFRSINAKPHARLAGPLAPPSTLKALNPKNPKP